MLLPAVRDTLSIAMHGCEQVTVDSIEFHPDSAQFTDFTFTNITKSFIPPTGTRRDACTKQVLAPSNLRLRIRSVDISLFIGSMGTRSTSIPSKRKALATDMLNIWLSGTDTLSVRMRDLDYCSERSQLQIPHAVYAYALIRSRFRMVWCSRVE